MGDTEAHNETGPTASDLSVDRFRTELDVFSGPLDLLLHLIKRNEVDVLDVPVSSITDQYLQILRAMQMFDVNVAAEFLVMAATLMDIKSRSLLPEMSFEDEDEPDPGGELVRQLLQYKRFKQAAEQFEALRRQRALKFARVPVLPESEPEPVTPEKLLEDVNIWHVLTAYAEVVRQIELHQPAHIIYDDTPVASYMDELRGTLYGRESGVDFLELFEIDRSRERVIGVFLALLELVQRREVLVDQDESERSHIRIAQAPPGAAHNEGRPPEAAPALWPFCIFGY